jgi:hypothetical protein
MEDAAQSSYEEAFQYDLSSFSLRFEKCQDVLMYDDEIASEEGKDTPLALKHFVVFRLCPTTTCASNCDSTYGTYTVTVEDYLKMSIEYQRQDFENMCENCNEQCNENGEYCSGCGKICYQYQNLEASGYLDAAAYTECQPVQVNPNDDGAEAEQYYYVGPRCTSSSGITIGVFSDENCWEPVDSTVATVEGLLGAKLSYHLLRHTYSNSTADRQVLCLSCAEEDFDQNNANDVNDGDDVNEMCEYLYDAAAKCESSTGLENGFIQTNRNNKNNEQGKYENQVANEFMACTFIHSLIWNSYTETGEIDFRSPQDLIIREVTKKQKLAMVFLSFLFVVMFGLIVYFHKKIAAVSPPEIVSSSGGQGKRRNWI